MITNEKQIVSSEKEKKQVITEHKFDVSNVKMLHNLECGYAAGGWGFLSVQDELPYLQEKVFSHVSHRLLQKHNFWYENGQIRLSLFVDFLLQARELYVKATQYHGIAPNVVSGSVVFPNDLRDEITIIPNPSGKLSIKLASEK